MKMKSKKYGACLALPKLGQREEAIKLLKEEDEK